MSCGNWEAEKKSENLRLVNCSCSQYGKNFKSFLTLTYDADSLLSVVVNNNEVLFQGLSVSVIRYTCDKAMFSCLPL